MATCIIKIYMSVAANRVSELHNHYARNVHVPRFFEINTTHPKKALVVEI